MQIIYILLSFCFIFTTSGGKRTKLTIYYETLCPDSEYFIQDLAEAYEILNRHMQLDFVPFGKARMGRNFMGEWIFRCQHGEQECFGNVIHACALDQNLGDLKNLQFIKCTMTDKNLHYCAQLSGVNSYLLTNCLNTKGASLLASYGKRTFRELKTVSFVPTIIFDDVYNSKLQSEALENLTKVICNLQNNPVECNKDDK